MNLFTITVNARECALRYRHGSLEQVLPAGRHRRVRGSRYVRVDLRDALLALSPQEVLTSDAVPVKVTATVRWSVGDPVAFVEQSSDPLGTVYLAAQVALRGRARAAPRSRRSRRAGAVVPARPDHGCHRRRGPAGRWSTVAEVVVKDVILPSEVRHAAAELLTARHRGAAQLEAARRRDGRPALAGQRRQAARRPPGRSPSCGLVQSAPPGTQLVLRVGAAEPVREAG